jgi:enamine deaminase RidA (YjgF/YER057c/UK114 family)
VAGAPKVVNPARPSRFTIEVENLPVNGWLVEVEVDAVYPE